MGASAAAGLTPPATPTTRPAPASRAIRRSAGVSMRQVTANSFTLPSSLVALTLRFCLNLSPEEIPRTSNFSNPVRPSDWRFSPGLNCKGTMPMPANSEKVDILVVDDRPDKLLALEAILAPLNENIVKATSGDKYEEAVECGSVFCGCRCGHCSNS